MDLERLAHVQAIRDVLARYWRGVDRADPALVRDAYHPDAWDDHGYYRGDVDGFVDSLAAAVWPTFERTQHFSGHVAVELDGEHVAHAESYAEAHHILRSDDGSARDLVYGLRYVDRLERRDDVWRIAHRVCTWDWQRSDENVGLPLGDGYQRGARDRTDPVFEHPQRTGEPVPAADLVAKQACRDALARYARGVDRCRPDLVRASYHDGAWDDHGGYQGDVDGFVAWVSETVMGSFQCTMHKLGNSLIEVDGDVAWGETYAIAHHVQSAEAEASDLIMGVRYLDRFERHDGDWKVAHRVMSFEWERALAIAEQSFAPGSLRGQRDGRDPAVAMLTPSVRDPIGAPERTGDREAILAKLHAYCRGVDRRDEALLRSAYWPDASDHHGAYEGDVDGFVAFVAREVHARFRITMHKLGQTQIAFSGPDAAHAESYAIAHHVRSEAARDVDDLVMGLRYLDRFERRDGDWRIARREVRYEWQRSDGLDEIDGSWTPGRTDRSDPVYART